MRGSIWRSIPRGVSNSSLTFNSVTRRCSVALVAHEYIMHRVARVLANTYAAMHARDLVWRHRKNFLHEEREKRHLSFVCRFVFRAVKWARVSCMNKFYILVRQSCRRVKKYRRYINFFCMNAFYINEKILQTKVKSYRGYIIQRILFQFIASCCVIQLLINLLYKICIAPIWLKFY